MPFGFRRGDLPEPAPKEVRGAGMAPGFNLLSLSPSEVDAYCRAHGVTPDESYRQAKVQACVDVDNRLKVMPTRESQDPVFYDALSDHENAHTWGYVHKGERGWRLNPAFFAKNPQIVNPALVGKAPPLRTRNVFAEAQPMPQGTNPFRD